MRLQSSDNVSQNHQGGNRGTLKRETRSGASNKFVDDNDVLSGSERLKVTSKNVKYDVVDWMVPPKNHRHYSLASSPSFHQSSLSIKVEDGTKMTTPPLRTPKRSSRSRQQQHHQQHNRDWDPDSTDYERQHQQALEEESVLQAMRDNPELAAMAAAAQNKQKRGRQISGDDAMYNGDYEDKDFNGGRRRRRQGEGSSDQTDQKKYRSEAKKNKEERQPPRYYRMADGTVKKVGGSSIPYFLEEQMAEGIPVKSWLIICAVLGVGLYQLRKTLVPVSAEASLSPRKKKNQHKGKAPSFPSSGSKKKRGGGHGRRGGKKTGKIEVSKRMRLTKSLSSTFEKFDQNGNSTGANTTTVSCSAGMTNTVSMEQTPTTVENSEDRKKPLTTNSKSNEGKQAMMKKKKKRRKSQKIEKVNTTIITTPIVDNESGETENIEKDDAKNNIIVLNEEKSLSELSPKVATTLMNDENIEERLAQNQSDGDNNSKGENLDAENNASPEDISNSSLPDTESTDGSSSSMTEVTGGLVPGTSKTAASTGKDEETLTTLFCNGGGEYDAEDRKAIMMVLKENDQKGSGEVQSEKDDQGEWKTAVRKKKSHSGGDRREGRGGVRGDRRGGRRGGDKFRAREGRRDARRVHRSAFGEERTRASTIQQRRFGSSVATNGRQGKLITHNNSQQPSKIDVEKQKEEPLGAKRSGLTGISNSLPSPTLSTRDNVKRSLVHTSTLSPSSPSWSPQRKFECPTSKPPAILSESPSQETTSLASSSAAGDISVANEATDNTKKENKGTGDESRKETKEVKKQENVEVSNNHVQGNGIKEGVEGAQHKEESDVEVEDQEALGTSDTKEEQDQGVTKEPQLTTQNSGGNGTGMDVGEKGAEGQVQGETEVKTQEKKKNDDKVQKIESRDKITEQDTKEEIVKAEKGNEDEEHPEEVEETITNSVELEKQQNNIEANKKMKSHGIKTNNDAALAEMLQMKENKAKVSVNNECDDSQDCEFGKEDEGCWEMVTTKKKKKSDDRVASLPPTVARPIKV